MKSILFLALLPLLSLTQALAADAGPDVFHRDFPDASWRSKLEQLAIQSGGRVNTTKAAELVIHDLRSGALGRITLETPEEFARWLAEGKKADAERAARKEEFAQAKAQKTSQRARTRR